MEFEISKLARPRVLGWLIQEHFDEVDALWERRESLIFDRDWTLIDLDTHERRMVGHIKGLRVAGSHALDLARDALANGTRQAALAATHAIFDLEPDEPVKVPEGLSEDAAEV